MKHLLEKKLSPEQITERLPYLGWKDIPCHETIYRYTILLKEHVVR